MNGHAQRGGRRSQFAPVRRKVGVVRIPEHGEARRGKDNLLAVSPTAQSYADLRSEVESLRRALTESLEQQ